MTGVLRDLFQVVSTFDSVKVLKNYVINIGVGEFGVTTLFYPFQDLDIVIKLATFPDFFEER